MPDPRVRVTIVDESSSPRCEGECGADWSKAESLALARDKVAERFGDQVTVQYVDLLETPDSDRAREIKLEIKGMPLPVLMVNGKARISGIFDIRQLMDVIEVELEARLV